MHALYNPDWLFGGGMLFGGLWLMAAVAFGYGVALAAQKVQRAVRAR
ncbi:MAG: hypothetical protein KGK15_12580 [Burkholderiales bacterium]|nr:hypothetical protein [Burkholderiales bacterium]MDE2289083.1 hypothetical protein [Burkholderiales bacterium]MDE2611256.1 hypothetical protein [Burkholderiales bacterium]